MRKIYWGHYVDSSLDAGLHASAFESNIYTTSLSVDGFGEDCSSLFCNGKLLFNRFWTFCWWRYHDSSID